MNPRPKALPLKLPGGRDYSIPYRCFMRHSCGVIGLRGASVEGLRAGGGVGVGAATAPYVAASFARMASVTTSSPKYRRSASPFRPCT